jgi:hypothetical protein
MNHSFTKNINVNKNGIREVGKSNLKEEKYLIMRNMLITK